MDTTHAPVSMDVLDYMNIHRILSQLKMDELRFRIY